MSNAFGLFVERSVIVGSRSRVGTDGRMDYTSTRTKYSGMTIINEMRETLHSHVKASPAAVA